MLFGQAGNDTFVFDQGTGGDVIGDFTHGQDKIDVHAFRFASFADLQSHFIQHGSDGAIDLGTLTTPIRGPPAHHMSTLDAGDFIQYPAPRTAN